MTRASDIRDWIEFIAAIAGVAGLLWAVVTYLFDVRATQRKEDLGSICCDEEKLGYFVVKEPAWWKPWKPWARVDIPKLPTITGLIKVCEAGVWSSQLAEEMITIDNAASWRPFYEAFFRNLTRYDKITFPEAAQHSAKAHYALQHLPKDATDWAHQAERRHVQRDALYETGPSRSATLIACMRSLDYIDNGTPQNSVQNLLQGNNSIWWIDMQRIWIYKGRPCIKVSEKELAALALSFGVILRWKDDRKTHFHGVGAFGLSLDGRYDVEVFSLRLEKSRPTRAVEPTMGSGYSILFAKHVACGFLPFGQRTTWTCTLRVNKSISEAVRKGDDIAGSAVRPADSTSLSFLLSLPRHKPIDVYDGVHTTANGSTGDFGRILESSLQAVDPENPDRWTWAGAVAGIAFGGLVPLATRNLVEAVRLTAQGVDTVGSRGTETYLPEQLERMVNWVHNTASGHYLFGTEGIPGRIAGTAGVDHVSYLPSSFGVPTVATIFSRYTVMLERLVALATEHGNRQDPAQKVYDRLRGLLSGTHDTVIRDRNPGRRPENWQQPVSQHLGEYCQNLRDRWKNDGSNVTIDDCADVARLMVLSWTYLVNLVSWQSEEEVAGPFETLSPTAVQLMSIGEVSHDLAMG